MEILTPCSAVESCFLTSCSCHSRMHKASMAINILPSISCDSTVPQLVETYYAHFQVPNCIFDSTMIDLLILMLIRSGAAELYSLSV